MTGTLHLPKSYTRLPIHNKNSEAAHERQKLTRLVALFNNHIGRSKHVSTATRWRTLTTTNLSFGVLVAASLPGTRVPSARDVRTARQKECQRKWKSHRKCCCSEAPSPQQIHASYELVRTLPTSRPPQGCPPLRFALGNKVMCEIVGPNGIEHLNGSEYSTFPIEWCGSGQKGDTYRNCFLVEPTKQSTYTKKLASTRPHIYLFTVFIFGEEAC
jgi:hypothetical protein